MKSYRNPSADAWYRDTVENLTAFPIEFTYNGTVYTGLSPTFCTLLSHEEREEPGKIVNEFRFAVEKALHLHVLFVHYPAYGVSEWTVRMLNPSDTVSGVLENICSSLRFTGSSPVLKGICGDRGGDYRPYTSDLSSAPVHLTSNSGRATHGNFPYFNLEYGNGGVMLAVGWAGTWTADFRFDGENTLYTARSVNGLHTRLKPGESIRTALFIRAPYTVRQENYATNYWRSWFIEHNLPAGEASGEKPEPFSTCCLAGDTGLPNSDGSISENHTTWKPSLMKMLAEDVRVDFRWFDAGWYIRPDGNSAQSYVRGQDWWDSVGTWVLDPVKWPGNSFRESTDFARANGMKTLMWFEPERVTDPDSLAANYRYKREWAICREGVKAISNNIGDPECYAWTLNRIKKTLTDNRVEMYREDNNCDPAGLWCYLDMLEGDDRTGITECKFIDAHYRMWDEIIACTLSFGGCGFVDSCASGGGRNDLESLRRGIPLLRSDSDRTTTARRLSMTTSFNRWVPFCGASTREKRGELDTEGTDGVYTWRASYLPVLNVVSQFSQTPDADYSDLRFGLREWERVNPYLLKDFYVLTPWKAVTDAGGFTAFSYYDEDTRTGVLLSFRQEACEEDTLSVTLPFVGKDEMCILSDEDSGEEIHITGEEMHRTGVTLTFPECRSCHLHWIEIVKA